MDKTTELIVTAFILVGGVGFAVWFMGKSAKDREARETERRDEDARQQALRSGLAAGDRPMWDPMDPDPLARKILDDGDAHNSKHTSPEFRRIWWETMDGGSGMAAAFFEAMQKTCWRRDSRKQVYDRLFSHGLISEGKKNEWHRDADRLPEGHGVFAC